MNSLHTRLTQHPEKIVIERNPYYTSAGHLFAREYGRSHFAKFGEVITHKCNLSIREI